MLTGTSGYATVICLREEIEKKISEGSDREILINEKGDGKVEELSKMIPKMYMSRSLGGALLQDPALFYDSFKGFNYFVGNIKVDWSEQPCDSQVRCSF